MTLGSQAERDKSRRNKPADVECVVHRKMQTTEMKALILALRMPFLEQRTHELAVE